MNGVQYEVTLYQGNHSNEYLLSEIKNGKVEGRCQLFNRGILSLSWMMKNGKRIGEITEYENGKALQRENWNSILGNNGDRRMIENGKEGLIMAIRCKCKHEMGEENDVVIYRGGFDKEMNRNGYGVEYDIENGKEKIEGYWIKDKLIRMIREFDAETNQMIEYAENNGEDGNGNMDLLNRVPIYIGGYCIENGKYVRNGVGYLIDETSRTAIRESEWEHGEERQYVATLYKRWYVGGMKETDKCVLSNQNQNQNRIELKSNPIVNVLPKRMKIYNSEELYEMDLKVEELVICSGSCNDLHKLDLRRYKSLQSIEIGNDCFESVQVFNICELNRLKTLIIGENSFNHKIKCDDDENMGSFTILNCESLESIEIAGNSFCGYNGEFYMFNLPQLQSIRIGIIGSRASSFPHFSFGIRSNDMILNI